MAVELTVHFVFGFTKDVQAKGCDPLLCLLLQALRSAPVVTGAFRWRILAAFQLFTCQR
jgi:hypothetical protein